MNEDRLIFRDPEQPKTLCIYHGNCADGFGAAWVVRKAHFGQVDFHAGVYQDPPPDVKNRDVVLVDFSYKKPIMEQIIQDARSVIIIDHHKSAIEDLEPLTKLYSKESLTPCVFYFDIAHSGAMLAWKYYFPDQEPPKLLQHIEDRDLWKFQLEGTREIQAALFSYPYDFEVWDGFMQGDCSQLHSDGKAIERKHFKDIDELLAVCQRRMMIGGYNVPVANLPYTLSSDAGGKMAQGEPFAACYQQTPTGVVFSLRSRGDDAVDVSEIAKQYGGGGHKNAAGFRVDFRTAMSFEVA